VVVCVVGAATDLVTVTVFVMVRLDPELRLLLDDQLFAFDDEPPEPVYDDVDTGCFAIAAACFCSAPTVARSLATCLVLAVMAASSVCTTGSTVAVGVGAGAAFVVDAVVGW
jgi:hypothetical protein